MSGRSFRSVFMVASCAGAALGCYLVSLRVASERAALEDVETKIVLAQRDIRLLQTEIGTRGRLAQLERWNVKVIALSAPTADQFLKDGFELARLTTPEREAPIDAPVILASAPAAQAPAEKPAGDESSPNRRPSEMMHLASLKTPPARKGEVSLEPRRSDAPATLSKPAAQAAKTAPTEKGKSSPQAVLKAPAGAAKETKPKADTAKSQTARASALTATKKPPAKKAASANDPLAPLPEPRAKLAAAKTKTSKDSARKQ